MPVAVGSFLSSAAPASRGVARIVIPAPSERQNARRPMARSIVRFVIPFSRFRFPASSPKDALLAQQDAPLRPRFARIEPADVREMESRKATAATANGREVARTQRWRGGVASVSRAHAALPGRELVGHAGVGRAVGKVLDRLVAAETEALAARLVYRPVAFALVELHERA